MLVVAAGAPVGRAAATLTLAPLDADGVAAIARSYAGAHEDAEVPVARLVEASGGVPQLVHRCAREWARAEAAKRLDAATGRVTSDRASLRAAEDDLAGTVVERQAAIERDGDEHGADGIVVCPFKGLASFDVDDNGFFFGRERLVAEMVARLVGAPLLGIVGPSGSGKSSALRAGLLPGLAEGVLPGSERWRLVLLRPGEHPASALDAAVAAAGPDARLVVAVDQFEEIFTACGDEDERVAFVDALLACARDPRRRALVLIAVRADFYGRCASYPELWRLLGANQVTVGPMRRDELRRAIELPARRAGLAVEPDLTDALISDVEGEPGALPLMSTALLELWQRRDGRRLRLAAYEQAGGVDGAVARLAERTYERLDPAQREIARRILLRLAGEGEGDAVVRRRVGFDELPGQGVPEVLDALADDRLVTVSEGTVEVAHEALLREWPRLRGWLEEDAHGRRLHQQLAIAAREWDAGGRDPGELYRGARLAGALEWAGAHEAALNTAERAFLEQSRGASERSQRRLRAVLVERRRLAPARRHRRRSRVRPARQCPRRGAGLGRAPAGRARLAGERSRHLAAARAPGRRPRRLAADPWEPPRGAGQEPGGDRRDAGRRRADVGARPEPRRTDARRRRPGRQRLPVRHPDAQAHRQDPAAGRQRLDHEADLQPRREPARDRARHPARERRRGARHPQPPGPRTFTPPRPGFVTAMRFTADDKIELTTVANEDSETGRRISCATTRGRAASCSVPCASTAAPIPRSCRRATDAG